MEKRKDNISKIITAVLLIAPILCVVFIALFKGIQTEAATTGTVTTSSLFVRVGPGTGYDVLTVNGTQKVTLSQGDYVAVFWEENGWYYISSSFNGNSIKGYVSKTYISASGVIPTGKPTNTPAPGGTSGLNVPAGYTLAVHTEGFPYTARVVVDTKLNIRDGAGANNNIIDTLKNGQEITVNGIKKSSDGANWYSINYVKDGKSCNGFASTSFIAIKIKATATKSPASGKTAVLHTQGFPIDGIVIADALNVRKNTDVSSTRLTILIENDEVTVLDCLKDSKGTYWYRVTFKRGGEIYTGYVVSEYIYIEPSSPSVTPIPTATFTPVPTKDPYLNLIRYYEIATSDRGSLYYSGTVDADVLNLRNEASANSASLAKLKNETRIIILEKLNTGNGWYKAAVKQNGKVLIGYVSADYIKIDYDDNVYGTISAEKTSLKSSALSMSTVVKNSFGNDASFVKGDRVLIISDVATSSGKWYKIRLTDGTVGYLPYSDVELTGGNVITTKPTPTPTNTPKPTATPKYTPTPKPTKKPTATPTPTALPSPVVNAELVAYPHNYLGEHITGYGMIKGTGKGEVFERPRPNLTTILDVDGKEIYLTDNVTLTLFDIYTYEKVQYRHVQFVYGEEVYYGYIPEKDIVIFDKKTAELRYTPTPIPDMSRLTNEEFVEYLINQGFPVSYCDKLIELHKQYPRWVFEAYYTNLDWETAIEKESKAGVNLIPNTSASGMLSTAEGAYNWFKDTYTVYDSPYWVTASEAAVAYYMDPRNWLDRSSIFMFETLNYKSKYQTIERVEELLYGTPFYKSYITFKDDNGKSRTISYAQAFIEAADYAKISPYHLVTRVRQEVVTGSTTVSNSVSGRVDGYEGYYNFYNIGAYHSTSTGGAIVNGLKYAQNGAANNDELNDASLIPWNNQYRAIVGGAYIIAQQYIARGQNTIYLQKFNVTDISTYGHQYMANVVAPYSEGTKLANGYEDINTTIVFRIPVFDNMPERASSKPVTTGNPNNILKEFKIYDENGKEIALSPSFDALNEEDYYITVSENNNVIQIVAKAVSAKAKVGGNGMVVVNSNADIFEVNVTAENGDVRTYRIHASKR